MVLTMLGARCGSFALALVSLSSALLCNGISFISVSSFKARFSLSFLPAFLPFFIPSLNSIRVLQVICAKTIDLTPNFSGWQLVEKKPDKQKTETCSVLPSIFVFLGPHRWHMEVPRLRVYSSQQCWMLIPLSEARDQTHVCMGTSWVCNC